MSSSTMMRFCERCGTNTPHTAKPFVSSTTLPTATKGLIDLTGGFAPKTDEYKEKGLRADGRQEFGVQHSVVPNTTEFKCTKCGKLRVTVGRPKGDVFEGIRRGRGF